MEDFHDAMTTYIDSKKQKKKYVSISELFIGMDGEFVSNVDYVLKEFFIKTHTLTSQGIT